MRSGFSGILRYIARYERPFSIASMVFGFCFDLIIAKRPDSLLVNVLLLSYLVISACCIVYLNIRARRSNETKPEPLFLLLLLKFCFGGLASNLFILYSKSGTPAGSILFLGILFAMLIGNEFLRTKYQETRFNIAVYYLLLLTYCIIAVPTFLLHYVGTSAFVLSGVLSLLVCAFFFGILSSMTRLFSGKGGYRRLRQEGIIVLVIFALYNLFYFTNIIPPVPLALKTIGVYHSLEHSDADSYAAQFEPPPWWQFWRDTNDTYHAKAGESAYCFSAVFAPPGLSSPIAHRWEHYDETAHAWISSNRVLFPIAGGRAEGYRGFSKKLLTPGTWRCDVETQSGSLIGRIEFTATEGSSTLQTTVL